MGRPFQFSKIYFRHYKHWFIPQLRSLFHPRPLKDGNYFGVPIIINNFNRYDKLLRLVDSLVSRGYHNIWIIDNGSTYPPLLEWYRKCPCRVILLHENAGHISIFRLGLYKVFYGSYYAYTDSDLEIDPECPADFMEKFIGLMKKYPKAVKVGFSLRIDDLPDCYAKKAEVIEWESQFWKNKVEDGVYSATIDTTFAVYRPYFRGRLVCFGELNLRTAPPYTMRHLPWYMDSANPTEEDRYYLSSIKTPTFWSERDGELLKDDSSQKDE